MNVLLLQRAIEQLAAAPVQKAFIKQINLWLEASAIRL